jgi:hypothetical protein
LSAALSLFLQVLPLALGAAMSPTFLAMQMAVLTSPAPGALRRGWALALGSMGMLLVLSFGGLSLLAQLPDVSTGAPSWAQAVILAACGIALLGVGLWERGRPVKHHDGLLARLVDARPPLLFAIGAMRLLTNASTLALYIPALHVITQSTVGVSGKALAFLMLFVITEAAVLVPVLAVTAMGDRATPWLASMRQTLERHSRTATIGLCFGLGVVLLVVAAGVAVQVL